MAGPEVSARGFSRQLDAFDDWFDSLDQDDTMKSKRKMRTVKIKVPKKKTIEDGDGVNDDYSDDSDTDIYCSKKNNDKSPVRGVARKTSGALEQMMMQNKATLEKPKAASTGVMRDDATKKKAMSLFHRRKADQAKGQARRSSLATTLALILDGDEPISPIPTRANSGPLDCKTGASPKKGKGMKKSASDGALAKTSAIQKRGGKKPKLLDVDGPKTPKKKKGAKTVAAKDGEKTPNTPKKKAKKAANTANGDPVTPKKKTKAANQEGREEIATPKKKKKAANATMGKEDDIVSSAVSPTKKNKKAKGVALGESQNEPPKKTKKEKAAQGDTISPKQNSNGKIVSNENEEESPWVEKKVVTPKAAKNGVKKPLKKPQTGSHPQQSSFTSTSSETTDSTPEQQRVPINRSRSFDDDLQYDQMTGGVNTLPASRPRLRDRRRCHSDAILRSEHGLQNQGSRHRSVEHGGRDNMTTAHFVGRHTPVRRRSNNNDLFDSNTILSQSEHGLPHRLSRRRSAEHEGEDGGRRTPVRHPSNDRETMLEAYERLASRVGDEATENVGSRSSNNNKRPMPIRQRSLDRDISLLNDDNISQSEHIPARRQLYDRLPEPKSGNRPQLMRRRSNEREVRIDDISQSEHVGHGRPRTARRRSNEFERGRVDDVAPRTRASPLRRRHDTREDKGELPMETNRPPLTIQVSNSDLDVPIDTHATAQVSNSERRGRSVSLVRQRSLPLDDDFSVDVSISDAEESDVVEPKTSRGRGHPPMERQTSRARRGRSMSAARRRTTECGTGGIELSTSERGSESRERGGGRLSQSDNHGSVPRTPRGLPPVTRRGSGERGRRSDVGEPGRIRNLSVEPRRRVDRNLNPETRRRATSIGALQRDQSRRRARKSDINERVSSFLFPDEN